MKVSTVIQTMLIGLTLLAFVPSSFAEEPAAGDEAVQQAGGRDVASKHKGKKKRHGHRGGRHHKHK